MTIFITIDPKKQIKYLKSILEKHREFLIHNIPFYGNTFNLVQLKKLRELLENIQNDKKLSLERKFTVIKKMLNTYVPNEVFNKQISEVFLEKEGESISTLLSLLSKHIQTLETSINNLALLVQMIEFLQTNKSLEPAQKLETAIQRVRVSQHTIVYNKPFHDNLDRLLNKTRYSSDNKKLIGITLFLLLLIAIRTEENMPILKVIGPIFYFAGVFYLGRSSGILGFEELNLNNKDLTAMDIIPQVDETLNSSVMALD